MPVWGGTKLESRIKYHLHGYDYKKLLSDTYYDVRGDYLNWGRDKSFDYIPKDPSGVVTSIGDEKHYNPCTIAQYCLHLYGRYIRGEGTKHAFLHQADFLLEMIEEDGSLRYYFDYPYYCMPDAYFKSGWASAMDSGHLLSVCARGFSLNKDKRWCDAAAKSLAFLQTPIESEGVLTSLQWIDSKLKGYTFFEEYPTTPPCYTLNGFMYTLIGLYDWSCIETQLTLRSDATELFQKGMDTLEMILPWYDIGGFTAYDLSHIILKRSSPHISVGYHCEHTAFCKIFYDITNRDVFNQYYLLWKSYVDM